MGQAKVKGTKSGSKSITTGNTGSGKPGKWTGYTQWFCSLFLMYLSVIYVMVCYKGYVQYDVYKRNILLTGGLVFVIGAVMMWFMCLEDDVHPHFDYKLNVNKIDFLIYCVFLVWGVSFILCDDKLSGFWGDVYRMTGLAFIGISMLILFLLSYLSDWKKINTYVCMCVLFIVFVWQLLNLFGVCPGNWQFSGTYPNLVACLANIDQNGMFDGIAIGVLTAAFVFTDTERQKREKIVYGVLISFCMAAGISVRSDTFFFGVAAAALIMVGYTIRHREYMFSNAVAMALYYVGIIFMLILGTVFESSLGLSFMESSGAGFIYQIPSLIALGVLVIVYLILAYYSSKVSEKLLKIIHAVYIAVIILAVVAGAVVVAILYNSHSQNELVLTLVGGFKSRFEIIDITWDTFVAQDIVTKMFGVGFNNYSRVIYTVRPDTLELMDGNILADSHNVFFDMLLAHGIVGNMAYFSFLVACLVEMRKAASKNPFIMIGILVIAGYLATGLINANLIVVTPCVLAAVGVVLKKVREINGDAERAAKTEVQDR